MIPTDFIFLFIIRVVYFSWSELIRVQFYYFFFFIRSELVRVDPSWSDPNWRSELIRSDFCTCLLFWALLASLHPYVNCSLRPFSKATISTYNQQNPVWTATVVRDHSLFIGMTGLGKNLQDLRCFSSYVTVVSSAAVIRVVTQCSSPLVVSGEEHCVTALITAAKETKMTGVMFFSSNTVTGLWKKVGLTYPRKVTVFWNKERLAFSIVLIHKGCPYMWIL